MPKGSTYPYTGSHFEGRNPPQGDVWDLPQPHPYPQGSNKVKLSDELH